MRSTSRRARHLAGAVLEISQVQLICGEAWASSPPPTPTATVTAAVQIHAGRPYTGLAQYRQIGWAFAGRDDSHEVQSAKPVQ